MATPLIGNFVRGHVQTVPRNMLGKCEVCTVNRFGAVNI